MGRHPNALGYCTYHTQACHDSATADSFPRFRLSFSLETILKSHRARPLRPEMLYWSMGFTVYLTMVPF